MPRRTQRCGEWVAGMEDDRMTMEEPTADRAALRVAIIRAFEDPEFAGSAAARAAVDEALGLLDRGVIRVAEPSAEGWVVNGWVRMAILLYFRQTPAQNLQSGLFEYRDKVPLKRNLEAQGIRLVPPGAIRYGAFLEPGVVVMPAYVNVGAHVGAGTMIDTWATVGSCAQIGRHVHVSGGVGIGGVLEPVNTSPVIIEDDVFLGSRSIIVEGVIVQARAVLGAGTVLTASTPIVDVRGAEPVVHRGTVPPGVVVVPGTWPRSFPAGTFHVPCALIVGERGTSTDSKTRLNQNLREFPLDEENSRTEEK
jgi:2,3,4,5-tetrahydropyridine-2,6-dicarboxylate N-succinyltransferase